MQITINLPDDLSLSEENLLQEVAIALFQQKVLHIEQATQIIEMDVDDFYQILANRGVLIPPNSKDDTPDELISAHLRISLNQIKDGNIKPISELWQLPS
jgi:predicted HTH domain antitoxin